MLRKASVFAVVLGSLAGVGCSNADRSLCLFTDTTIGFGLSFDSKSATPAKTTLGYNRMEGLLNPVYSEGHEVSYASDGTVVRKKSITPQYRNEAYSVIVKMNGHKQAEGQASANGDNRGGGQLFITGKAALLLAQNPIAVAALMEDREMMRDIARASAGDRTEATVREETVRDETVADEVVGDSPIKTASR